MKKDDNDILFDEKGMSREAIDRKFQAIPIVSGDDDTIEDVKLPDINSVYTLFFA